MFDFLFKIAPKDCQDFAFKHSCKEYTFTLRPSSVIDFYELTCTTTTKYKNPKTKVEAPLITRCVVLSKKSHIVEYMKQQKEMLKNSDIALSKLAVEGKL